MNDLEAKKPKGYGISASEFRRIIGRSLVKSKAKGDFLKDNDLQ